jgi:hypothetical protein
MITFPALWICTIQISRQIDRHVETPCDDPDLLCLQMPALNFPRPLGLAWYRYVAGGTAKVLRSQRLGVFGFSVDCENVKLESRWRAMKSTYHAVLIDLVTCCYRTDCKNSTPVHLARQTRNQHNIMRRRLVCSVQSVIPPLSRSLVTPFTVPDCVNSSVTTLPYVTQSCTS